MQCTLSEGSVVQVDRSHDSGHRGGGGVAHRGDSERLPARVAMRDPSPGRPPARIAAQASSSISATRRSRSSSRHSAPYFASTCACHMCQSLLTFWAASASQAKCCSGHQQRSTLATTYHSTQCISRWVLSCGFYREINSRSSSHVREHRCKASQLLCGQLRHRP